MRTVARGLRLAGALWWRSRRQHGGRLLLYPLGYTALMLGFWLVALYVPGVLTGTTQRALARSAELHFGAVPGRGGLALAMMFLQGPYLVALFSSLSAVTMTQGSVASEAARGGLELLAAAPISARELYVGLLAHALALAAVIWLGMVVGFLCSTAAGLMLLGASVHFTNAQLGLALAMPLPMGLWSSLIALALALRFPRLAGGQGSLGLSRVIALQPSLLLLVMINFRPDLDPLRLALGALGLGLAGAVATGLLLGRGFRFESFLTA